MTKERAELDVTIMRKKDVLFCFDFRLPHALIRRIGRRSFVLDRTILSIKGPPVHPIGEFLEGLTDEPHGEPEQEYADAREDETPP